jgi:hypothetical protein
VVAFIGPGNRLGVRARGQARAHEARLRVRDLARSDSDSRSEVTGGARLSAAAGSGARSWAAMDQKRGQAAERQGAGRTELKSLGWLARLRMVGCAAKQENKGGETERFHFF